MDTTKTQEPTTDDAAVADATASDATLREALEGTKRLHDHMLATERAHEQGIRELHPEQQASARNLLHYLAMRREDLRPLQDALARHGLSSLGRCEAHVLATLQEVISVLSRLVGTGDLRDPLGEAPVDFQTGSKIIQERTRQLFGDMKRERGVNIMVTMPSEAAESYELVSDLVAQGMDCMRINCAHDNVEVWLKMIEQLRRAETELGRKCRIVMDLGGPKLRTGPLREAQPVLRWKPKRDSQGRVLAPARVWMTAEGRPGNAPVPADIVVRVVDDWLEHVSAEDEIRFRDAAGRKRVIHVVEKTADGVWGEAYRTAYLTNETELKLFHKGRSKSEIPMGKIGLIQAAESYMIVRQGDRLILCNAEKRGGPARYDDHGRLIQHAHVGCTLPEVFADLKVGQRILFDDGRITGRIEDSRPQNALVEITSTRRGGDKLRSDKGINLPDTNLNLGALTEKDVQDLEFIVNHADMVGYSFVRRPDDIWRLQAELDRLGKPTLPILLKIENRQAFANLPPLLLAAMGRPLVGVMIARGDLAVECGWQRMAEVQEEILWMCEAAHMPVVWATQVLEDLAKEGIPTRAEITDAAMSVRAECVMLNKGPHILKALHVLDDILTRMRDHQVKKRPLLRRLRVADNIWPE